MVQCLNAIAYHESILTLWMSRTEWNALFPGLDISQARSKYGGNVSCCFTLTFGHATRLENVAVAVIVVRIVTSLVCDSPLWTDSSKEKMVHPGHFLSAGGLNCHHPPKSVHSTLTPVGQLPAPFPHAAGLPSLGTQPAFISPAVRHCLLSTAGKGMVWLAAHWPRHSLCPGLLLLPMSHSVQPHRRQPTRLPHPWDSPGRNAGVGCHFLLQCRKVKSESEVAQPCLTPSDPMDRSPPGSSIHGIFQARVLEWGACYCLLCHVHHRTIFSMRK